MARTRGPGQLSFADVAAEGRRRKLEAKRGRHLVMIDELVPWEDFRPVLEAVWRKPRRERKSAAGRKPWDTVLMFKAIVLGALYNPSDELEHEIGDRLTFMRFLGLGLQDRTPDATTVWQYRERLAQAGIVEELFDRFDSFCGRVGTGHRGARSWMLRSWRCRHSGTARRRRRSPGRERFRNGGWRVLPRGWHRRTWTRGGRSGAA